MTDEEVEKIIRSNMNLQMNLAGIRADFEEKLKRTWVGLTWSDVPDQWLGNVAFMEGGKWAEKTLKEKNT